MEMAEPLENPELARTSIGITLPALRFELVTALVVTYCSNQRTREQLNLCLLWV